MQADFPMIIWLLNAGLHSTHTNYIWMMEKSATHKPHITLSLDSKLLITTITWFASMVSKHCWLGIVFESDLLWVISNSNTNKPWAEMDLLISRSQHFLIFLFWYMYIWCTFISRTEIRARQSFEQMCAIFAMHQNNTMPIA